MAFRLDNAIVRGWIDNTTPGVTRGGLELVGVKRPLQIVLRGDCCRDLAGTRLDFINPNPKMQLDLPEIHYLHRGVVGEMTASRKVKIPTIPSEEFENYIEAKKEIPFEWKNELYLEWFSLASGRVVIETADFELKLSAHTWELDEKEEKKQELDKRVALEHFMELITHANEAEAQVNAECLGEADEFEWERRLRVRDTLEETAMFLSDANSPEEVEIAEEEKMRNRFGLVRRSFRLQSEVLLYMGNSFLDDGARGELALAVGYIFDTLDEAWPENGSSLEIGFKIAVLKRAIDASIAAVSACNTLEMEDDGFGALRNDIFIVRDEMVIVMQDLRDELGKGEN